MKSAGMPGHGAFGWAIGGLAVLGGLGVIARRSRRYDLEGKVVLITGGTRGLGLLLARRFAAEGSRLVVCARDQQEVDAAAADLESRGAVVLATVCDIGDAGQVERLVHAAVRRFGRVDVVVNNAGIIQTGPLETMSLKDFHDAQDAIFWGAVHTTLAVLPELRARGEGRIVNITSIGGTVAVPHLLPYTAAKYAMVGFSEGLHAELGRHGIVVTTVVPGLMRTGSFLNALFKGQQDAEATWFSVSSALPGLSMDADRAARRIVEACKAGEGFVTVGVPAKALRLFHALLPGTTGALMSAADRLLPGPGGEGPEQRAEPGRRRRRGLAISLLTSLGRAAARETHEIRPGAPG